MSRVYNQSEFDILWPPPSPPPPPPPPREEEEEKERFFVGYHADTVETAR
jgi:hypothetical protein